MHILRFRPTVFWPIVIWTVVIWPVVLWPVVAAAALAPVPVMAGEAAPPTRMIATLTESGARSALQAAEQLESQAHEAAAIAVVDQDGLLLVFGRMDGARPGSIDLAIGKARAAALLHRPSEQLEANARERVGLATVGLTALRGGAPLEAGGAVVGAVGIAGIKKEHDASIAAQVAASFGSTR